MKASSFPRVYRAYDLDEKVMYSPEKLAKLGFTIAPDGLPSNALKPLFNIVVMWFSGQHDHEGKPIFEGDICRCDIMNEFGSLTVDYGIMRWNPNVFQFILMIPSAQGGELLNVQKVGLLGNEFDNPELVPLVKNELPVLDESVNG
jgi:hypothetical protein